MRFDPQKAFPYPVLRPYNDDYKDGEYQTTVDFVVGGHKIIASVLFHLSSEEMKEQVELGNAEFAIVISCRDTYYRHKMSSKSEQIEEEFDIGSFRGEVRADSYIVVKKDIDFFTSNDINNEFGPGPFKYTKGDILAQDEPQVFYIERDYFKPITSVFELVKKEELTESEWRLSFNQDRVQIELSSRMKDKINDARNNKNNQAILINSIYFAAVMQAIHNLKESYTDFEDYKWADVITKQAHNKGIDIESDDIYYSAEKLMDYPLSILDAHVFRSED